MARQKAKLGIQIAALCLGTGMCIVSVISHHPFFLVMGNIWLAVAVVLGMIPTNHKKET